MRGLLSLLVALGAASAQPVPATPAPAVFALVVANNHSYALGRAPLRYADDDGARYHEMLSMLAEPQGVALLTELDEDSRGLFPALVPLARPPTSEALRQATRELAARVRQARAQGREVDFYFVYAGHGDVDKGRGFLELRDRAFDSEDLQALLREVDATRAHVLLDSCNSFFVVSPRKPGGRRFATPADMTKSLATRLPAVGVLLSTSAEAEVFEWSELQSGVFSHVVRSGLTGAADADGDGRVTYRELAAFASIATQAIPNPLFRPRLFSLGPGRQPDATLVDLRAARSAVTLRVDTPEAVRLTLRDARGLRWADLHKETGTALAVRLPAAVARGMEVVRPAASAAARAWALGPVEAGASVALTDLAPSEALAAARGVQDQLRQLFAEPYGTLALERFEAARTSEPEPVYGISRSDQERMRQLVETFSAVERDKRNGQLILLGTSVAGTVGGSVLLLTRPGREAKVQGLSLLGAGLLFSGMDVLQQLRREDPEVLLEEFQRASADAAADPGRTIAQVDYRLARFLAQERRLRRQLETAGWLQVGTAALVLLTSEVQRFRLGPSPEVYGGERLALGLALSGASYLLRARYTESASEHLVRQWNTDPELRLLPRVALVPSSRGASLVLGASF